MTFIFPTTMLSQTGTSRTLVYKNTSCDENWCQSQWILFLKRNFEKINLVISQGYQSHRHTAKILLKYFFLYKKNVSLKEPRNVFNPKMAISKTKTESTHITLQAGFSESPKHLDFVLTQEPGSINFNIYMYDAQKESGKNYTNKPSP